MSHHFSLLKQADLIAARRDGQQIYYSLNTTVVQDLIVALFDLVPAEAKTEKQVDQEVTDSGKKK